MMRIQLMKPCPACMHSSDQARKAYLHLHICKPTRKTACSTRTQRNGLCKEQRGCLQKSMQPYLVNWDLHLTAHTTASLCDASLRCKARTHLPVEYQMFKNYLALKIKLMLKLDGGLFLSLRRILTAGRKQWNACLVLRKPLM